LSFSPPLTLLLVSFFALCFFLLKCFYFENFLAEKKVSFGVKEKKLKYTIGKESVTGPRH
jgi:hypothetical protein